jgi:hypothetical protein
MKTRQLGLPSRRSKRTNMLGKLRVRLLRIRRHVNFKMDFFTKNEQARIRIRRHPIFKIESEAERQRYFRFS